MSRKRNRNLRRKLERVYKVDKSKVNVHPSCRPKSDGKFPKNCQVHHKKRVRCGGNDRLSNLEVIPTKLHYQKHRTRPAC